MTTNMISNMLLWCTIINYAVLIVWFLCFILAHDWLKQLHGRWFQMSAEQFNGIHYLGMAIYKIGILLLNLVPYIALLIVGRTGG
jgi:hypothetical protein